MKSWLGVTALVLLNACDPCWDKKSNQDIVQCLGGYPVEDLQNHHTLASYVNQHKIYISLTTSPQRLPHIHWALQTLDLTYVESIFLALPEKYKNVEPYGSTEELERQFPKLRILRRKKDLGPIMKLLPAIEEVRALGDLEARIITIDDDIGYPKDMVGQLIKESVLKNAITTGSGKSRGYFGLGPYWPQRDRVPSQTDLVEGYGAVAYPVWAVDVERMKAYSNLGAGKVCFTSDDLVISWVLAEQHLPRYEVKNSYFPGVRPFDYGLGKDALHQGAGCEGDACGMTDRYQACAKAILEKNF